MASIIALSTLLTSGLLGLSALIWSQRSRGIKDGVSILIIGISSPMMGPSEESVLRVRGFCIIFSQYCAGRTRLLRYFK